MFIVIFDLLLYKINFPNFTDFKFNNQNIYYNYNIPVNKLATDVDVPNWVSMYLGKKTTKPETIAISQQMAGSSNAYTGFCSNFKIDLGISAENIVQIMTKTLTKNCNS